MILLTTPRFDRAIKKILPVEKKALDLAVKTVIANPLIGKMKTGDLSGIQVYKFRYLKEQILLVYAVSLDRSRIVLMGYGVHEDFYRDLKR